MINIIIWAIVELLTIAVGTGIFVTNTLYHSVDEESAGIGAFMVVFGLLLRSWKKDLFASKDKNNKDDDTKPETNTTDKNVVLGVLAIAVFTMCALIK